MKIPVLMNVAPMHLIVPALLLLILGALVPSFACPLVSDLVDRNCDGRIKITIAGDSVVAGAGDTANGHHGGYPKRLQKYLGGKVRVMNLGVYGYTTPQVLSVISSRPGRRLSRKSDYFIIDAGRNDCRDSYPTSRSLGYLSTMVKYIKRKFRPRTKAPLILIGTEIPTTGDRQRCVEQLNAALLQQKSARLPAYLRFDKLSAGVLSSDRIHPDSDGYQEIALFTAHYLLNGGTERALKDRPDNDKDGIYDIFEKKRYKTDPSTADSDGDGYTDGEEVFERMSDPLVTEEE